MGIAEAIVTGVVGSIIGAFITARWLAYREKRKKKTEDYLNYLKLKSDIGIDSYVASREDGIEKIKADLIDSKKILVLNFVGWSMLDKMMSHQNVLYQIIDESKEIRDVNFLLLDCINAPEYVKERYEGLEGFSDDEIQNSLSGKDLYMTISKLKQIKSFFGHKKIDYECRLFKEILKWSLIFSDKSILCTFYTKGKIGSKSPGLIINRESLLGKSFEKYFNDLWKKEDKLGEIKNEKN